MVPRPAVRVMVLAAVLAAVQAAVLVAAAVRAVVQAAVQESAAVLGLVGCQAFATTNTHYLAGAALTNTASTLSRTGHHQHRL